MIPEEFIEELLARVDIVDVISEHISLKKAGQNHVACCPFHHEKTPSFTVSPSKQFYHCFGCGAHGTAIGFLMEYSHLSFPEAIENLANRVGMMVPKKAVKSSQEKQFYQEKKSKQEQLQQVLQACAEFYQGSLKQHPEALSYLHNRGINDETIEKFGLGYAPDGWENLATAVGQSNALLVECGMLVERDQQPNSYYDRFRKRLMFPIRDGRAQMIGFGGRVIRADEQPKYLNSPETILFNKGHQLYGLYEARAGIRRSKRVLVVEGYMDVVALSQYGVDYAVATLGTATTAEHAKILLRESDEVYFCFDGDRAGRRAAWRALENSLERLKDDKTIRFLFLPTEHDPDSYICQFGANAFETLLMRQSEPLSKYWLQELSRQVSLDTVEGRAALVHLATPMLAKITAPNLRFLLTQALAEKAQISMADMGYVLANQQKLPAVTIQQSTYRQPKLPVQTFRQPEMASLATQLIRWLLINPQWAIYVRLPEYMVLPEDAAALAALAGHIKSMDSTPSAAALWDGLRGHRYEILFQKIFAAAPSVMALESGQDDEKAFQDGIIRLQDELNKRQMNELLAKSSQHSLTDAEKNLLKQLLYKSFGQP